MTQNALAKWLGEELAPGPSVTTSDALETVIRQTAASFYHPVSTCRMGPAYDSAAVVDPSCRVRAVADLRIVDASIMPSIPNAMTNAATVAVAEGAADLIKHPARTRTPDKLEV